MKSLSVVISAFNEEKRLTACLKSVAFADEIIVIDNSSTDKTHDIARKYTQLVFIRENNFMLNVNKNFGFTKATSDWTLSLDADEQVTDELQKEIKEILSKASSVQGYRIPRKNILFGKWIQNSIWWPDYQLRLFRTKNGKFPEKHVHEMLEVSGKTEQLHAAILHDNYSSISQYITKMNTIYTESEAENFLTQGKKISWVDALRFPANDFLKTFFAQKGYKDGLHGLVLSLLQAFYALIVFAKIWEKQGFTQYDSSHFLEDISQESKKISHELKYWLLTQRIESSSHPIQKFISRLRRKLYSQ